MVPVVDFDGDDSVKTLTPDEPYEILLSNWRAVLMSR